jgi:hypothetical protein
VTQGEPLRTGTLWDIVHHAFYREYFLPRAPGRWKHLGFACISFLNSCLNLLLEIREGNFFYQR